MFYNSQYNNLESNIIFTSHNEQLTFKPLYKSFRCRITAYVFLVVYIVSFILVQSGYWLNQGHSPLLIVIPAILTLISISWIPILIHPKILWHIICTLKWTILICIATAVIVSDAWIASQILTIDDKHWTGHFITVIGCFFLFTWLIFLSTLFASDALVTTINRKVIFVIHYFGVTAILSNITVHLIKNLPTKSHCIRNICTTPETITIIGSLALLTRLIWQLVRYHKKENVVQIRLPIKYYVS